MPIMSNWLDFFSGNNSGNNSGNGNNSGTTRSGMNGMYNPGTVYGRNSVGEIVNPPASKGNPDGGYNGRTVQQEQPYQSTPDMLSQLESWWKDYQSYLTQLRDNTINQNRVDFGKQRNIINANYARKGREIQSMYGLDQGRSIGLRSAHGTSWANKIGELRNNWAQADAKAKQDYSNNLANARTQYMNQLARYM